MINNPAITKALPNIGGFFDLFCAAVQEEIPTLANKVFLEKLEEDVYPSLLIYFHTIENILNDTTRENTAVYIVNFEYREILKTKAPYEVIQNGVNVFMALRNRYSFNITAASKPGKIAHCVFVQDRMTPVLQYDQKERPVIIFQLAFKIDILRSVL